MHIIACIEDPAVIRKILTHLQEQSPLDSGVPIPNPRAPPQALTIQLIQRNFPALPHVAAQNGFDRVSVGLRMAIGGETGNKRRDFGAVCRNQETIPDCQA